MGQFCQFLIVIEITVKSLVMSIHRFDSLEVEYLAEILLSELILKNAADDLAFLFSYRWVKRFHTPALRTYGAIAVFCTSAIPA